MTTEQKELKDRLDIKNIKTVNTPDGLCINCDLYFDNKKIANYHNDGNGGGGEIHEYATKHKDGFDYEPNRSKVQELTNLISKLPQVNCDEYNLLLTIDIDWVIEELTQIKLLNKKFLSSIVTGIPSESEVFGTTIPKNQYNIITFKNVKSLSKMDKTSLENHIAKIKEELKDGEIIFNTNI